MSLGGCLGRWSSFHNSFSIQRRGGRGSHVKTISGIRLLHRNFVPTCHPVRTNGVLAERAPILVDTMRPCRSKVGEIGWFKCMIHRVSVEPPVFVMDHGTAGAVTGPDNPVTDLPNDRGFSERHGTRA